MKKLIFTMLLAAIVLTGTAAALYVTPGGYYVTTTGYGSYDLTRNTVNYNAYSGYGVYDGDYGLVDFTPYPYPRTYSLEENRLSYGEYSRFTGRHHNPMTGRVMPETWRGYGNSNAIPPHGYAYALRTIHHE